MEEYLIYFYQKGNNNDIYECKIIIFLLDEKKYQYLKIYFILWFCVLVIYEII